MPPPLSQLQCMNYSCWDSGNKEWTVSLPGKESATGLSLGNGWVTVATDKQLLRVFSLGGMQRDVISVAGVIVGVAGWGSRLAVIYQEPPCEFNPSPTDNLLTLLSLTLTLLSLTLN